MLNPARPVREIRINQVPAEVSVRPAGRALHGLQMKQSPTEPELTLIGRPVLAPAGRCWPALGPAVRGSGLKRCDSRRALQRSTQALPQSPPRRRCPAPQGPTGTSGVQLRFTASLYNSRHGTYLFGPTIRARAGDKLGICERRPLGLGGPFVAASGTGAAWEPRGSHQNASHLMQLGGSPFALPQRAYHTVRNGPRLHVGGMGHPHAPLQPPSPTDRTLLVHPCPAALCRSDQHAAARQPAAPAQRDRDRIPRWGPGLCHAAMPSAAALPAGLCRRPAVPAAAASRLQGAHLTGRARRLLPADPTHTNLHGHGLHDWPGVLAQLDPPRYIGGCPLGCLPTACLPAAPPFLCPPARLHTASPIQWAHTPRPAQLPLGAPLSPLLLRNMECACCPARAAAGGDNVLMDIAPNGGQFYWTSELPRDHMPGEGDEQ